MSVTAPNAAALDLERRAGAEAAEERRGLTSAGASVLAAAKGGVRHVAELAAAEARLAALSGVAVLAFGLLAGAALILAWGLVVILVIDGLRQLGVPWQATAAGLALVHVLAAFVLVKSALGLSRNLGLPRLRHALLERSDRA